MDQYVRDVDTVDLINVNNESNDIHEEAANCISILKQNANKHTHVCLSPVTEKWVDKDDKKSSLDVPNKSVRLASKSSLSHLHLFLLIQFLLALCLII